MFSLSELEELSNVRIECTFDCFPGCAKVAFFATLAFGDDWLTYVPRVYADAATKITFHFNDGTAKVVKDANFTAFQIAFTAKLSNISPIRI